MSFTGTAKSILEPVYFRLPQRLCYGKKFWEVSEFLEQSQWWDRERLAEYQLAKLRIILKHAGDHVPYYRALFRSIGFDPRMISRTSDLRGIPLLDKATVLASPGDFIADNIGAEHRLYFTTGGTMGQPLGLYNLRDSGLRERAFIYSLWARAGFRRTDQRAILRGWAVRDKQHWRYNARERAYIFSNFHMTPENVARYAGVMRRRRLGYLHVFPSAAIDFARHLKDLGLEPPRFRTVLAASENLYPGQRDFIESFYGARMFSWYGHTENVILAGECEVSNYYHIYPEYGFVEVIREDGSQAEAEGDTGELVGTSLDNLAMPLIRYRTDDWAVIGPPKCECGRNYPLLKETYGRWHQEMLVGNLNNLISVTALNLHNDAFDRVQQLQFYQREKGKVELRIRRKPDYTETDSRRILESLNEKIGDTAEISIRFTDEIPLMPRGKFRLVIREIELPRAASEVPVENRSF
jgi:phenylacetate-CoA ligase